METCAGDFFYHKGRLEPCEVFEASWAWHDAEVYEVLRVTEGVPLFLEDHLDRLAASLALRGERLTEERRAEVVRAVRQVIRHNRLREGNVRVVVHEDGGLLVYRVPHHYPSEEMYRRGVCCLLFRGERPRPQMKVVHRGLRLAVYDRLVQTGCYEALLVNRRGEVTEGSRSNLFAVRDGTLFTAPDTLVLPGISRKYVIEVCAREKIPLVMQAVKEEELASCEALFLTGTSIRVLPVSRVEGMVFDPAHPLVRRIREGYERLISDYIFLRRMETDEDE